MAEVTISTNNNQRAQSILIGMVVVALLTYWHFTGSLPLLASSIVPEPEDSKLGSVWSFGVELLADFFYFVGVAVAAFSSGLWSLVIGLIRVLVSKSNVQSVAPDQAVTRDLLDKRTKQVFAAIETPLNDLSQQVKQLEEKIDCLAHPVALAPAKPTRRRTQRSQS